MSSAYLVYGPAMPYSETLGSVKCDSSDKHSSLLGHATVLTFYKIGLWFQETK
jgi:hypothetical protein